MKRILLVAAENGALPGGKVGGVGDVMRDLPLALAANGWHASVVTPAYGIFNQLPEAQHAASVDVDFAGAKHTAAVWEISGPDSRVTHLAIEHPLLSPDGPDKIYCSDDPDRPFATDAGKFAFFSAAIARLVKQDDAPPDVIHLHDWHTALYLVLREFDPAFKELQNIHTVYTIHNLAFQGIRPLANDQSSLAAWFPALTVAPLIITDPRYGDCINPMAAAIRLADKINTVSPTYAREILRPNDPAHGFSGGEGLENDLQQATSQSRLTGILNGCEYPKRGRRPGWNRLLGAVNEALAGTDGPANPALHAAAIQRFATFPRRRPGTVLTSVGRLTAQKTALFLQPTATGPAALESILDDLGKSGVLIMLGSGDPQVEQQLGEIASRHDNFLFLCGFFEPLAELLYQSGDFFLMPSSFEPCGISQMLAMRAGQPCIAHAVGGLKDTIQNDATGFLFDGDTPAAQADRFVATVLRARRLKATAPEQWQNMRKLAAAQRFSWQVAAEHYEKKLYESSGS